MVYLIITTIFMVIIFVVIFGVNYINVIIITHIVAVIIIKITAIIISCNYSHKYQTFFSHNQCKMSCIRESECV